MEKKKKKNEKKKKGASSDQAQVMYVLSQLRPVKEPMSKFTIVVSF